MSDPDRGADGDGQPPGGGMGGRADGDGPERSPLAQAWDIARYAPVALLLDSPTLLPKLAESGKVHVRNARVVGEMAVRQGTRQARQRFEWLDDLDGQARGVLQLLGILPGDGTPAGGTEPAGGADPGRAGEAPAGTEPPASSPHRPVATVPGADPRDRPSAAGAAAGAPPAAQLAIPDYESLSASQVVSRLPGLSPAELEAVHAFETAHRGRRTILNRIAQLRA